MRIRITPSGTTPEAADFAQILKTMYTGWALRDPEISSVVADPEGLEIKGAADDFLNLESGIHRLTRISRHDPQKRRTTTYAHVSVNGEQNFEQIRHYVTDPYKMAKDLRDEDNTTTDVDAVFSGDLSHFYKQ